MKICVSEPVVCDQLRQSKRLEVFPPEVIIIVQSLNLRSAEHTTEDPEG